MPLAASIFTAVGRNFELTCGTFTPVAGRLMDENLGGPRLIEKLLENAEEKPGDWKVDWKVDENGACAVGFCVFVDRLEKPVDKSSTAGAEGCGIFRCVKI